MPILSDKKSPLRLVLDESVIYLEESFGSLLIRGEAIVNFDKPTPIQGPIEILFKGIQRFYPWNDLLILRPIGDHLDTTLQSIELSLLPPHSNGIMPAGTHRFPFEFPISSALPPTVSIPKRVDIFYQISATLRRSHVNRDKSSAQQLLDWARLSMNKKSIVTTNRIRLIRATESIPLPVQNTQDEEQQDSDTDNQLTTSSPIEQQTGTHTQTNPWDQTSPTHRHVISLDEQIDRLAFSLAGRTVDNFSLSPYVLNDHQGIRFRTSIDRTVIVLGTSVGVEVHLQPTIFPAKIQSIVLSITETRKYKLKIPADPSHGFKAETRRATEINRMLLKWAYCYPPKCQSLGTDNPREEQAQDTTETKGYLGDKFNQKVTSVYTDQSSNITFSHNTNNNKLNSDSCISGLSVGENSPGGNAYSLIPPSNINKSKLVNLKDLNHPVDVGEAFDGRFELAVPSCSNLILHPSMEDESVRVSHWLNLTVTILCNGKTVELNLESQARMLDCRLVAADDEGQMIMPPPPSYNSSGSSSSSRNSSSFWEQRQPITMNAVWGTCKECPCKIKSTAALKSKIKVKASKSEEASRSDTSLLPEWGPPPCYSDIV
ncbi:hypothetical protein CLU79DRAFT_751227 [Phycomyces nitens]|nr:hypothetical protein CLU79DRAFT_751227 [Phycomyces nitens]